jgi:hypothetical protein
MSTTIQQQQQRPPQRDVERLLQENNDLKIRLREYTQHNNNSSFQQNGTLVNHQSDNSSLESKCAQLEGLLEEKDALLQKARDVVLELKEE